MPIFSRRSLQRMLRANVSVVGEGVCSRHARQIDDHRDYSLDAEWEVAVIYALSRIGAVEHEVAGPGRARLDICFSRSVGGEPWFVGDVVCVSDKSIEARNPVQPLRDSLAHAAKRARLKPQHFGLWINGGPWRERDDYRMKAYVPRGTQQERASDYLRAFALLAATTPGEGRSGRVKFDDVDFGVSYSPRADGISSGGVPLDTPISAKLNPLFSALKRKARQLKQAALPGLKGIIVADGGSRTFGYIARPETTWLTKTLTEFFRVHSSVDFVVILRVDGEPAPDRLFNFDSPDGPLFVDPILFTKESMPDEQVADLLSLWCGAVASLPTPVMDPRNALNFCHTHRDQSLRALNHLGGWVVTKNSIKVSAVEVLRLLAGDTTPEDFRERNRLYVDRNEKTASNPFARALKEGRTISAVNVERAEDFDDDWLTFELSDPDAALARLSSSS